jgi:hypothetical protein
LRGLEGIVAVAQQHAHRARNGRRRRIKIKITDTLVGRHDVELTVPVEVSDGHGLRVRAGRVGPCRLEGAVAIACLHADAAVCIRGDEVELAVAVEVCHHHGLRVCADRVIDRGEKTGQAAVLQGFEQQAGNCRLPLRVPAPVM